MVVRNIRFWVMKIDPPLITKWFRISNHANFSADFRLNTIK
jgi:hypothetical protein